MRLGEGGAFTQRRFAIAQHPYDKNEAAPLDRAAA
jgi:hypothetical protein